MADLLQSIAIAFGGIGLYVWVWTLEKRIERLEAAAHEPRP